MGNASAKEGDNGDHMAAAAGSADAATGAPPDAVMLERPPHMPYLFAPQVMMINYPKQEIKDSQEETLFVHPQINNSKSKLSFGLQSSF
jgi:hypothetical protein